MNMIYARRSVSVTELKRSFAQVVEAAAEGPIAVLNHNRPEAYLIGAEDYERLIEMIEDIEDERKIASRAGEESVPVTLDDL